MAKHVFLQQNRNNKPVSTWLKISTIIYIFTWLILADTRTALADFRDETNTNKSNYQRLKYKYLGNKESLKFHRFSCPYAICMSRCRRKYFFYRLDAIKADYSPCRYCLPKRWTSTQVVLLKQGK